MGEMENIGANTQVTLVWWDTLGDLRGLHEFREVHTRSGRIERISRNSL